MFSEIDIVRLTGFLFLFLLATSVAGGALAVVKPTESPDEVAISLRNVAKDPGKQRTSIIFNLVAQVGVVALAPVRCISRSVRTTGRWHSWGHSGA